MEEIYINLLGIVVVKELSMGANDVKDRTLILVQTDPSRDVVFNAWQKIGLNVDVIFKPKPKLIRFIRRLWANHFLPGFSQWYGDWKNNLSEYDTVIVHADVRTRTVPKFIHSIKPSMRIIYWYWNPVNNESLPELTKDNKIECWSFDENDCTTYGMKRNIQYYYEPDMDDGNLNLEYDLYFVGRDKGRKETINQIKSDIEKARVTYKFDVYGDSDVGISYREVQDRIQKAKAILEINQNGQVGCTLRALEALFFRKKLITTNNNIKKEDFYNPNNIFVYGVDDIQSLKEFVNSPYDKASDIYKEKHTIEAWFLNFFERSE